MKLPIFTELTSKAKDYFRNIGEYIDNDFIPANLYQELGLYAVDNEIPFHKEKKRNIVFVKDEKLVSNVKPYAAIALNYLGYKPDDNSLKVDVMLDGGTRPLRFRFDIGSKKYGVYLKLSEPTTVLLRELYKRTGNLSVPYRSITSPKFTIEEEVIGFHRFEVPKELQSLSELDGYANAVIAFDVCKFFAGIGDLEKAANSIISFKQEFLSINNIVPIDFNMSQIYNQGIINIIKINRTSELNISSEEYTKIYEKHEKTLWKKVQDHKELINILIASIESMYELSELAMYIKENYSQLEKKYGS